MSTLSLFSPNIILAVHTTMKTTKPKGFSQATYLSKRLNGNSSADKLPANKSPTDKSPNTNSPADNSPPNNLPPG
jgi:hypothetical protein